jgi:hypothetical protein
VLSLRSPSPVEPVVRIADERAAGAKPETEFAGAHTLTVITIAVANVTGKKRARPNLV